MMKGADGPILLAEDNADDALLVQRAFRKARVANSIYVVSNGEDAIDYLANRGRFADRVQYPFPVLLLLDLQMPRKTRFEVLEWLRAQQNLRRLPVVILTSSGENPDINRAYELGANSYLCKPVEFENLIEMVRAIDRYWLILNESPDLPAS